MKKWNKSIVYVVVVLVLIGISFYGGMKYGGIAGNPPNLANDARRAQQQNGGPVGMANRTANTMIFGEIISIDAQSLTLKLTNGSTKIVFYTDKTPLARQTTATVSELKTGETVSIMSSTNADGSITAKNIQIGKILINNLPGNKTSNNQLPGNTASAQQPAINGSLPVDGGPNQQIPGSSEPQTQGTSKSTTTES